MIITACTVFSFIEDSLEASKHILIRLFSNYSTHRDKVIQALAKFQFQFSNFILLNALLI